jgi:hypothetical protein
LVLCNATGANNLELIQFLLAGGANPNLGHDGGFRPLFGAAGLAVVQALVVTGADIHAEDGNYTNVVAMFQDVEILRFFLERGVDPNHEDGLE